MADPVDDRVTSGALDRLRDCPRRAHVVDHRSAWFLREDRLRKERSDEVARHELAAVVDEKATIGIAVERHAEVRALLARLGDDELAVFREERIRLVIRE